ncbi:MAG: hypothetical protein HC796_01435 [Synechococcaceae cyanobacterium RL_1_2]|nr:hypothetical protein [Synechococcaceae cyanobacterium RL_1_2]
MGRFKPHQTHGYRVNIYGYAIPYDGLFLPWFTRNSGARAIASAPHPNGQAPFLTT